MDMKKLSAIWLVFITIALLTNGCLPITRPLVKHYHDPYHKKLAKVGFKEKFTKIGEVELHYSEGPENGPALVLLHAQLMDWFDYSRVLLELSKTYQIYVIDYPGHGKTKSPDYIMNAHEIGEVLAQFISNEIKVPAFVSGNSSGGLLTLWLASNKPHLVKAILLEDPPLFSSEFPRIKETIAYRSFQTSHTYLENKSNEPFLNYWIKNSSKFIEAHAGKNSTKILLDWVETYENSNPGKPVEIKPLPQTIRMMFRGLSLYDPSFGNAFFNGSWNQDFDHASALQQVECPVLLLHANYGITEEGILNGAMTQEDADRAMQLLKNGVYEKIDAQHVVHLDKPKEFIQLMNEFFLGIE